MSRRLADRRALVVGGAGGIGSAVCRRLADEGAVVTVVDVAADRAEAIAREVGGTAVVSVTEVADTTDILVTSTLSVTGDNLVTVDDRSWSSDLEGTLTAPMHAIRAVLPGMIARRGGAIVAISSVNAQVYVGNEAYSAAKAALDSLVRSVAARYGRHGVRCNAVAPGTIRTDAWEPRLAREPDLLERLARHYPLGRVGEPDEVAAAVAFLASDDASFISGETLRVDGGLLAGLTVMADELLVESRDAEV